MRATTAIVSGLMTVSLVVGCSSSEDSEPTPSSTTVATEPAPDPWPKRLKVWERENAIPTSDWFDVVKVREVRNEVLWVETSLPNDAEAAAYASPICGGYSTIALEYPKIDIVTVRAGSGNELQRCGPGA